MSYEEISLEENEIIENLKLKSKWIEINIFMYNIALAIMGDNEDHESKSVDECWHRNDWPK